MTNSRTGPAVAVTRERLLAAAHRAGFTPLDLSLGVPPGPAPTPTRQAAIPAPAHGYPPSAGTAQLRAAITAYLQRRFSVDVPTDTVAACAGAKEFIGTAALFLRDDNGRRDTVLVPELCYPTYAAGAALAGLRGVRVPLGDDGVQLRLDLLSAETVRRSALLWVNSPVNPTGGIVDLDAVASWARKHDVPVLSDEAYAELTWHGQPRTILATGVDRVVAVHSLSKRSNSPGLRIGFYAGDPTLVQRLVAGRRHVGIMPAAHSQAIAVELLTDDDHAATLRLGQARRVHLLVDLLNQHGLPCTEPAGGMFVWLEAPGGSGEQFARLAAECSGLIFMPGSLYGAAGRAHVRIAAVAEADALRPRIARLAAALAHHETTVPARPDGGPLLASEGIASRNGVGG